MHRQTTPHRPQARKRHRIEAALIILLTANMATMLVPRPASAQPLQESSPQLAHQEMRGPG
jgi:hypothetical protein